MEVNPLCGQRRSLLAQIRSRNNHITLRCKSLIAINQMAKKAYLESNAVVCRGDNTPVPFAPIDHNPHAHRDRTPAHARKTTNTSIKSNICNYVSIREDTTHDHNEQYEWNHNPVSYTHLTLPTIYSV